MDRLTDSLANEIAFAYQLDATRTSQSQLRSQVTPQMANNAIRYALTWPTMSNELMTGGIMAQVSPDDGGMITLILEEEEEKQRSIWGRLRSIAGDVQGGVNNLFNPVREVDNLLRGFGQTATLPGQALNTVSSQFAGQARAAVRTGLLAFNGSMQFATGLVRGAGAVYDNQLNLAKGQPLQNSPREIINSVVGGNDLASWAGSGFGLTERFNVGSGFIPQATLHEDRETFGTDVDRLTSQGMPVAQAEAQVRREYDRKFGRPEVGLAPRQTNPDDPFDVLPSPFANQNRRRDSVELQGRSISPGGILAQAALSAPGTEPVSRYIATHVPIVSDMVTPGDEAYSLLSGLGDFVFALKADPSYLAGRYLANARHARTTLGNTPMMTGRGRHAIGYRQLSEAFADEQQYAPLIRYLNATPDGDRKFIDLFDAFESLSGQPHPPDPKLLADLAAHTHGIGTSAIEELLTARLVGAGVTTAPDARLGRVAETALRGFGADEATAAMGRVGGLRYAGRVVGNERFPKLFRYLGHMSTETLESNNIAKSIREYDRMVRGMGLSRERRGALVRQFATVEDFDTPAVQQMVRNAFGEFRDTEFTKLAARYPDGKVEPDELARFNAIHQSFEDRIDELQVMTEAYTTDIAENLNPGRLWEADVGGVKMIPSAYDMSELLGNTVFVPNARLVRLAQSPLVWLTRQRSLDNILDERWFNAAAMTAQEDVWKVAALMRPSWVMRILPEEQLRNTAALLTTYMRHPVQAFRIMLGVAGDEGRLARIEDFFTRFTQGHAGQIRSNPAGVRYALDDALYHSEGLSRGTMNLADVGSRAAAEARGVVLRADDLRNRPNFLRSWWAKIRSSHADPLRQHVARRILDGWSDRQIADELMFTSDGRNTLNKWAGADEGRRQVVRSGTLVDFGDIRLQVEYEVAQIHGLSGGRTRVVNTWEMDQTGPEELRYVYINDQGAKMRQIGPEDMEDIRHQVVLDGEEDLIRAIADGNIAGSDLNFDEKAIISLLDDYADVAPPVLIGKDFQAVKASQSRWDRIVETMFGMLMSGPTNLLNRSPAFREFQWKATMELMPFADDVTLDALVAAGRDANLPSAMMEQVENIAAHVKRTRIDDASILFRDYTPGDVTNAMQRAMADLPETASGLPVLYSGTRVNVPTELTTRGTIEATADVNWVGPALYASDNPNLAGTYFRSLEQMRHVRPDVNPNQALEELVKARASAIDDFAGEGGSIMHVRFVPDRPPNILNIDSAGGFAKFDDVMVEIYDGVLEALAHKLDEIEVRFPEESAEAIKLAWDVRLDNLSETGAAYPNWANFLDEIRTSFDGDYGLPDWTATFDEWVRAELGDDVAEMIADLPDGTGHKKAATIINQYLVRRHNIDAIEYAGGVPTGSKTHHRAFGWLNTDDIVVEDALDMFADAWTREQGSLVRNATDFVNRITAIKALNQVQDLLYDLSNRHQYMDAARLLFPFGEAFIEIFSAWSKLLAERPIEITRRSQQALQGARQSGFFHEGPYGEETVTMPGGGVLSNVLGSMGLFGDEDVSISLEAPVTSFNLFTQSMLPGFGPTAQFAARLLPESNTAFDKIKDFVSPYEQSRPGTVGAAIDSVLPAWFRKLQVAVGDKNDPTVAQSQASVAIDLARGMLMSGKYPDTAEGREAAIEAAGEGAGMVWMARSAIQFLAPSSPILQFEAKAPTGKSPDPIIPEEWDTSGRMWAVDLFISDYQDKLVELEYDDFLANNWFVGAYGFDPTALITAKTRQVFPRSETEEGYRFQRNNDDLFKDYEYAAYYLYPDDVDADFDFSAYYNQIITGSRERLSPDEWLEAGNHARASMIYRSISESLNDTAADRDYLRSLREILAYEYPGFRTFDIGLGRRPDTEESIAQIKQMMTDNPTLNTPDGEMPASETAAGRGIIAYLGMRDWALAELDRLDISVSLRARAALPYREQLRSFAQSIISNPETADFADAWLGVFKRELDAAEDESPTLVTVDR